MVRGCGLEVDVVMWEGGGGRVIVMRRVLCGWLELPCW